MKSSEEMLNSLFERREGHNMSKRKLRKRIINITAVMCVTCMLVMLGAGLFNKSTTNKVDGNGTTECVLFKASGKDVNTDAFGEDELHHIDVVLDGNIIYKQLPLDEYEGRGFGKELKPEDFGQYLGKVTEIFYNDTRVDIGSKEPTLAGSEVYYYTKTAKATVIVKDDKHCSLFVLESLANGFEETYELFGADGADDIAYLSYSIYGLAESEYKNDDSEYREIESGTITSSDKIEAFYKLTNELVPYESPSKAFATPDWYNEAWEEYRKNPELYVREDITVDIHFKNGAVCRAIGYQPYLSTGYVDGHHFLSEDNNAIMRGLFRQ